MGCTAVWATGFALAASAGFGAGFGVGVGVGVGVVNVGRGVTRNAAASADANGALKAFSRGIAWRTSAGFVRCALWLACAFGDAVTGEASTVSASAQLVCTFWPGHVNANAVKVNTTTANAPSANLDERGS